MNGDKLQWMDEDMIKAAEAAKEPADDPPSYYKPQPNNQGVLVWLCGGPGAGKSTTAKLLSEKHDFVYYEGDYLENAQLDQGTLETTS